jgi:N-acetylmuramoyl-L-alanine amidase
VPPPVDAPPATPAPPVVATTAPADLPSAVPVPEARPQTPTPDAELAALGAAAPLARALRRPTIVIDAGHGGIDPGAIGGRFDTAEKDVTLRAARMLQEQLERSGRYRVVLTRGDDSYLPLRERLQRARDAQGDLLISLHADSLPNHREHGGASVYTLSTTASDKEAQRLATRENDTDSFADTSYRAYDAQVVAVLADLAMRDTGVRSERLAEIMAGEVGRVAPVVSHTRRSAGFVVLMSPEMPSVLVEMGYLSNATDEKRLRSDAYLGTLAAAIERAVDRAVEANLLLTR